MTLKVVTAHAARAGLRRQVALLLAFSLFSLSFLGHLLLLSSLWRDSGRRDVQRARLLVHELVLGLVEGAQTEFAREIVRVNFRSRWHRALGSDELLRLHSNLAHLFRFVGGCLLSC